MNDLKLPIALVLAMAAQLAGGVWWVSQQAATISGLEETVSQLGSKMAIEDNVNLRRDVAENAKEIDYVWSELDDVWDEHEALASTIGKITDLQQRVALLEQTIAWIDRDHSNMLDPRKMNMNGR